MTDCLKNKEDAQLRIFLHFRSKPLGFAPSLFSFFFLLLFVCLLAFYRHFSILGHEAYRDPEAAEVVAALTDIATAETEAVREVDIEARR